MTNCRKQIEAGSVFLLLGLISSPAFAQSTVGRVEFIGKENPSRIVIPVTGGPIEFEKQENPQDNQVIIELKNSRLASKLAGLPMDSSSSDSKVSLISPYQVEGQDTVRVVVQLREWVPVEVSPGSGQLVVTVSNPGGAPTVAAAPGDAEQNQNAAAAPGVPAAGPVDPPMDPMERKLQDLTDSRATKRFTGRPITLQVKDADVSDVFRLIGEASGFNIILGDDVKGKLTLSLVDVPWDLALDTILNTLRLGAERNNNILRVLTLANLTAEKRDMIAARKAAESSAPRVTRVFPISYANLNDLQGTLTKFASVSDNPQAEAALVQLDNRTNSIIVRDIPDNIEKMKKLIEILDTQTPQVLIEGKIIEASEEFTKQMGGKLGLSGMAAQGPFQASMMGGNPLTELLGGEDGPGSLIGDLSAPEGAIPGGAFGFSPSLGFISNNLRLNAFLSFSERTDTIKVVSSPRNVVLNKETATIQQTTPVLVPVTTIVAGVGPVASVESKDAIISLNVTPTITNDGSVLLKLLLTRDTPRNNVGVAKRSLSTMVVVESGTTLVIGGVYTSDTTNTEEGMPFLRKIPIIGWFFGNEVKSTRKSELLFFVTPKIINEKEAGLVS